MFCGISISFIFTSLDIEKELMENFEIISYETTPKEVKSNSDSIIFLYDIIVKSKTSQKIVINLKAKKSGIFRGLMTTCEGGNYI